MYTFFSYKKHVYKKHEAETRQKLRNILERWAGWVANNNLKNLFYKKSFENFLSNEEQIETRSITLYYYRKISDATAQKLGVNKVLVKYFYQVWKMFNLCRGVTIKMFLDGNFQYFFQFKNFNLLYIISV